MDIDGNLRIDHVWQGATIEIPLSDSTVGGLRAIPGSRTMVTRWMLGSLSLIETSTAQAMLALNDPQHEMPTACLSRDSLAGNTLLCHPVVRDLRVPVGPLGKVCDLQHYGLLITTHFSSPAK